MQANNRRDQKRISGSRGQSLVELALLLPFLLVLIIGALEFGRLFFTKTVITNAAREAAYYYSLTGDATNAKAAAIADAANSGIPVIDVDDISIVPKNLTGYDSVEVTVETDVENIFLLRIVGNAISGNSTTFHLSSTVEMMVQE